MKFFYWIGCRKFYQKALSYAAPPFRWENINSKDPFKTPSFFHTQHGPEWNNEYFYMWHFSELRATTAVAPFLPSDLKSWWFLFPIHLFNICIIILQLKASLIVKIEALGCWKRMRERGLGIWEIIVLGKDVKTLCLDDTIDQNCWLF